LERPNSVVAMESATLSSQPRPHELEAVDLCNRALGYVKTPISKEESDAVEEIAEAEYRVFLELGNGLIVAYLVDVGQRFMYLENKHLTLADITRADLHEKAARNLIFMTGTRWSTTAGDYPANRAKRKRLHANRKSGL
jgi:hypothetical protein